MTAFKKRLLMAALTTTLGIAIGAVAGFLLARVAVVMQARLRMERDAVQTTRGVETSIRESRAVLGQMNASAYPYCSHAELSFFRALIFQSHALKEAGRLRDGRIDCSTTLGHTPQQQPQLRPDFTQRDGALVYRSLPLLTIPGHTAIAVQLGDSYVVYNPFVSSEVASPHTHYTLTDIDVTTHAAGMLMDDGPLFQGPILTHNAQARQDGVLYATRCSSVGTVCVTAFTTLPEVFSSNGPTLAVLTAMGALAGALLGFICSLVYRRNKSLHHQLLRAIRRDALRVVYQPIVEIETGRIVEAEALVRWTDDDNQPVSPDVFIRVAEDGGFVGEITRLVARRVLRDFACILNARPDFRVNINIAASDLADPELLSMLRGALDAAAVRPESLGIEITESYTARQQIAMETILRLRERGHHVSIDDFGTGYSSLAYLHDLSVDAIKIDKAFTRAIGTDAVTVSILPQILSMAGQLGLNVIVEGIETQQQADYFAEANTSIRAQGWLFGHPVAVDVFLALLAENDTRFQPPTAAAHGSLRVSASVC